MLGLALLTVIAAAGESHPANMSSALKLWEGKEVALTDKLGRHDSTTISFVGADYFCVVYSSDAIAGKVQEYKHCLPFAGIRIFTLPPDKPFILVDDR